MVHGTAYSTILQYMSLHYYTLVRGTMYYVYIVPRTFLVLGTWGMQSRMVWRIFFAIDPRLASCVFLFCSSSSSSSYVSCFCFCPQPLASPIRDARCLSLRRRSGQVVCDSTGFPYSLSQTDAWLPWLPIVWRRRLRRPLRSLCRHPRPVKASTDDTTAIRISRSTRPNKPATRFIFMLLSPRPLLSWIFGQLQGQSFELLISYSVRTIAQTLSS